MSEHDETVRQQVEQALRTVTLKASEPAPVLGFYMTRRMADRLIEHAKVPDDVRCETLGGLPVLIDELNLFPMGLLAVSSPELWERMREAVNGPAGEGGFRDPARDPRDPDRAGFRL